MRKLRSSLLCIGLFFIFFSCKTGIVDNSIIQDSIQSNKPQNIISIEIDTLGQTLPSEKADGLLNTLIKMTVDEFVFEYYGAIQVQGSSTPWWPKKNWSLHFYTDETRTVEIPLSIGGSVPSTKWVAKADFIDPTALRNILAYTIWDEIVRSRNTSFLHKAGTPIWEVDNAFAGIYSNSAPIAGQGYPSPYPTRIEINGEFYGLAMLIMGHEPDNFNIDKNNPQHLYFEFDARGGELNGAEWEGKSWEKFTTIHPEDRSDCLGTWIDMYYPKNENVGEVQRAALNEFGAFINFEINEETDKEAFQKEYLKYFDKQNMIDMFLYLEMLYDWDAVAQDIEFVTYDLQKWFLLPWDKDTTFNMWWDNSGLISPEKKELLIKNWYENNEEKPWYKTWYAFPDEVKKRYKELRNNGVFSNANLENLISHFDSMYSSEDRKKEEEKWMPEGKKSLKEIPISQLKEWFSDRLDFLDEHFEYE